MTVADLIAELEDYDLDTEVALREFNALLDESTLCEIECVVPVSHRPGVVVICRGDELE